MYDVRVFNNDVRTQTELLGFITQSYVRMGIMNLYIFTYSPCAYHRGTAYLTKKNHYAVCALNSYEQYSYLGV